MDYEILSWKDIDKVLPIDTIAIYHDGGIYKIITRDKRLYMSHGWQKKEINKVCPAYEDIMTSLRSSQPLRPDWMSLNMGLGKKIYITSELRQHMKICNVSTSQLYSNWESFILDGIKRIDNYYENAQVISPIRVTPDHIESLEDNEVFVFGSNIFGFHDAGAAELAHLRFGAIYGEHEGHRGQSYAITTDGVPYSKTIADIRQFIEYAKLHPDLKFLVTKVGCGIAGYTPSQIAPYFASASIVENILLPLEFWKFLM